MISKGFLRLVRTMYFVELYGCVLSQLTLPAGTMDLTVHTVHHFLVIQLPTFNSLGLVRILCMAI